MAGPILSSSPRLLGRSCTRAPARERERRHREGRQLVAKRVAGVRVFQFGDRADVSRVQLRDVGLRFALQQQQVAEPLGCIARDVVDRRIGFHDPRDDSKQRDSPGKLIRYAFHTDNTSGSASLFALQIEVGEKLVFAYIRRDHLADLPAFEQQSEPGVVDPRIVRRSR